MGGNRRWLSLWRVLRNVRREVDEELDLHVAMRTEALERSGLSRERARAEAESRLGDRELLYASARDRDRRMKRAEWLDGLRRDMVLAVRRAVRSPGATLLALLTYGLGIGLTTAGFAVVDSVLLRPLPFPESDRLVALEGVDSAGSAIRYVSVASWREWREHGRTLSSSALYGAREFTASGVGDAYRVSGQAVVGPFFEAVGSPLVAGRAFTEEEIASGGVLAVVSERFWRAALGGRELPLELRLNGRSTEVVGVIAAGRGYPRDADVWVGVDLPVTSNPEAHTWVDWFAVGRLAPGVTESRAAADLSVVARAIRASNPAAIYAYGVAVEPLREFLVGDVGTWLFLLVGAVGFVLLTACANLAGLGIARASTRAHEMEVRTALGAGRRRLVRQLLVEQVTLGLAGGALGVLLAMVATRLMAARAASFLPRASDISLSGSVLAFAFGVSLLAGLLAGLLPAFRASSSTVRPATLGSRGTVRGGRGLPGAALVAAEVAVALLLVTGSGLLVQSFRNVVGRDLGFRTASVVTARIALTSPPYATAERRIEYWESLADRLSAVVGVERVGFANSVPGGSGFAGFFETSGRPAGRDVAGYRVISDDYLDVLGVRVREGRDFDARDTRTSRRVALVNEAMARAYWPDRDAVGERVKAVSMEATTGAAWLDVIGVVSDVRHFGYESDIEPEMYVLYRQVPEWTGSMAMVVRAAPGVSSVSIAAAMGRAVRAQDPEIAPDVAPLDRQVDALLRGRRFVLAALGGFALLALVLGAIGVYGMLSFAVARRTAEIGIRAALGAGTADILALIMRSALVIVGIGVAAGLLAAFWLTRLLANMLVGVAPNDPVTFAAAVLALAFVAAIAAFLPAWRATRVDPLDCLRRGEG